MRRAFGHTDHVMWQPRALIAVALIAALLSACGASGSRGPHGHPDPGGKRLAALARVAREALPSGATSTHLSLTKSTWGHGGCDGGPAGWTKMEAVELFRASGNVATEVDANMRRLHWVIVSKLNTNTSPAGQPPSAAPGADAPWAEEYEPSSDPTKPVAWLYTPAQAGGPRWKLDLQVAPAEVPDHAC